MFERQLGDELQLKELLFKIDHLDLDDRRVHVSQRQDKTLLRHFINDIQTAFGSASDDLLNELFAFNDFFHHHFAGGFFLDFFFTHFLIHGSSP